MEPILFISRMRLRSREMKFICLIPHPLTGPSFYQEIFIKHLSGPRGPAGWERKEALLSGGFHSDGERETVNLELEATHPRLVAELGSLDLLPCPFQGPIRGHSLLPGEHSVLFFSPGGKVGKE